MSWYVLSQAFFAAALFSKTVTASLPAALLVVLWWQRGRLDRRSVWPILPFLCVAIPMGLLTAWMERHVVGAVGPEWNLSFVERFAIASRAVWFYLGKIALPKDLCFNYRCWDPHDVSAGRPALAALFGCAGGRWLLRSRIGRGPVAAAMFFVGTLLPALGFSNVFPMRYSFVADHFQYLVSSGVICPLVAGLYRMGRGVQGMLWLGVLTLGLLTRQQVAVYGDLQALWEHTLACNPGSRLAHNQLGSLLRERGELSAAESHFHDGLHSLGYTQQMNFTGNFGLVLFPTVNKRTPGLSRSRGHRRAGRPKSWSFSTSSKPSPIPRPCYGENGTATASSEASRPR